MVTSLPLLATSCVMSNYRNLFLIGASLFLNSLFDVAFVKSRNFNLNMLNATYEENRYNNSEIDEFEKNKIYKLEE